MTTPGGQPFNSADHGAYVGVQGQTVTITGDVQLTVGQDASSAEKYKVGAANLKSGNSGIARKLIWEAMMGCPENSKILFHWLVAMLSGRTVRQFSQEEIDQLKHSRSRYAETGDDAWADGVRLIYRLLDSTLPSLVTEAGPKAATTDMSLLVKQFDDLGDEQRDMVLPHLELFLTGPLKDEMWQLELERAQSGQHVGDRRGRAWMFFQPIPAKVVIPPPKPGWISAADRLAKRASATLFVLAVGYLGWELLWHSAVLGLLGYVVGLAGGIAAAGADLELRFLTERRRLKDEQFRAPSQSVPGPTGDALTDRVDKLFKRYFDRYERDKTARERWAAASAGIRELYRDEILERCRSNGILADDVAWLIRYEVRQLKQRWQNETLYQYQRQLLPMPSTVAACRIGLAVLVLGSASAVVALRAYPLADVASTAVALLSGFWAWRCWLRIGLERRQYAADCEDNAQRQADIDKEFARWKERLERRPKDAEMAAWLECDRTVLLGTALDFFQLSRSRLKTHAFLEEPGVAVRRARIEGGPLRYAGYRLMAFLLAEGGVRQVRYSLDFTTGVLTERERTNYRYDAIVSVRVLHEARRGQKFELRLTAGEPITVQVRDADPGEIQDGPDTELAEETEEDPALDAASVANTLLVLEGVAAEGRNWFRGRDWAGAWSEDDEADRRKEDA
jgi:hypothetical protein